jgi:hypothetical protein
MQWKFKAALVALLVGAPLLMWNSRMILNRLLPIHHEGVVKRIGTFDKGFPRAGEVRTRQSRQFAILFEDGFDCEGYDTSFATVQVGDRISIKAYHDVVGFPVMDPEWWECDEAQLMQLIAE